MNSPHKGRNAFTLIELLVVIAIIGILAALLLSAISRVKDKAYTVDCLNNLKQLQLAALNYSHDFNDFIVGNEYHAQSDPAQYGPLNWLSGYMDVNAANHTPNTNMDLLLNVKYAQLGPYIKSAGIFRCKTSKLLIREGGETYPLIRTYSMNNWMGYTNWWWQNQPFKRFAKLTDLVKLTPSEAFMFVDERDDSVDEGCFVTDMQNNWIANVPSRFHNGSAAFSYADGHVGLHKWVTREFAIKQQRGVGATSSKFFTVANNNADMLWLRTHATVAN